MTATTLDAAYAARIAEAQAQGNVLRYVARVTPEGGTVGLTAVKRDGPLGALRGPGNYIYIALHTTRYRPLPLALSGPGAGREVTAAGVLGDILKLARQMAPGSSMKFLSAD